MWTYELIETESDETVIKLFNKDKEYQKEYRLYDCYNVVELEGHNILVANHDSSSLYICLKTGNEIQCK
jgi:hypothetical protein